MADLGYTVRVVHPDGTPVAGAELTIEPDYANAITYREYRTGPSPWWKRAWHRARRG